MWTWLSKNILKTTVTSLPRKAKEYLQHILHEDLTPPVLDQAAPPTAVELAIQQALQEVSQGRFATAITILKAAGKAHPDDVQIPPHLQRIEFLEARGRDPRALAETRQMQAEIAAMNAEIRTLPIAVPSTFWETHGKFHQQLLEQYGVENFKRTVAHNYQNWLMTTPDDPQFQQLMTHWTDFAVGTTWFNTIEVPSHIGHHPSFDFNDPTYPLAFAEKREIYRIAVSLLWELVRGTDPAGWLDHLEESEIGNPIRILRDGKRISSDVAHSVRERNLLLQTLSLQGQESLTVGELGAGQGRLAEIFGKTTNYRYYIFDITPALYVSQWYVKRLFPHEKIFEFRPFARYDEIREELESCRFAFFTANQILQLPQGAVDLFINMNSLMEMRLDQIQHYLGQIDRLTTRAFLSRQWYRWTNDMDQQTVQQSDFHLPAERWQLALDARDAIFPDFFNQIWQRR